MTKLRPWQLEIAERTRLRVTTFFIHGELRGMRLADEWGPCGVTVTYWFSVSGQAWEVTTTALTDPDTKGSILTREESVTMFDYVWDATVVQYPPRTP